MRGDVVACACGWRAATGGASRMVVSVTSTRFCVAHPCGELLRPELRRAAAWCRRADGAVEIAARSARAASACGRGAAARLGMAVDGHVGDDRSAAWSRGPARLTCWNSSGVVVDEPGRVVVVAEARMVDDALEEGEVGRHAADAELAQRPVHARDRLLRRRRPGGDLLQQRVVEAGDDRARIGGAAVEPDAEAGGAAIGGDAAIVGDEVVARGPRW